MQDQVVADVTHKDMANAIRSGRPHRANGDMAFHVLDVMQAFLEAFLEDIEQAEVSVILVQDGNSLVLNPEAESASFAPAVGESNSAPAVIRRSGDALRRRMPTRSPRRSIRSWRPTARVGAC